MISYRVIVCFFRLNAWFARALNYYYLLRRNRFYHLLVTAREIRNFVQITSGSRETMIIIIIIIIIVLFHFSFFRYEIKYSIVLRTTNVGSLMSNWSFVCALTRYNSRLSTHIIYSLARLNGKYRLQRTALYTATGCCRVSRSRWSDWFLFLLFFSHNNSG